MKAQEYFDKYFANARSIDEIKAGAREMIRDLVREYDEIDKTRKVKTPDGIAGIVRELNDKWNSVGTKVEKKFQVKILNRNVIWNLLLADKFSDTFPRKPD